MQTLFDVASQVDDFLPNGRDKQEGDFSLGSEIAGHCNHELCGISGWGCAWPREIS